MQYAVGVSVTCGVWKKTCATIKETWKLSETKCSIPDGTGQNPNGLKDFVLVILQGVSRHVAEILNFYLYFFSVMNFSEIFTFCSRKKLLNF